MTTEFIAGDRVRYTGTYSPSLAGALGTVRVPGAYDIYIDWDGGLKPDGVMRSNIEKIDTSVPSRFAAGEEYFVTVDGPQASNDTPTGLVGPRGDHRAGDRVQVIPDLWVSSDEVRTRALSGPAIGGAWTISKSQLSPVWPLTAADAPVPTERVESDDPNKVVGVYDDGVWDIGNEILFEATASVDDEWYSVGCKQISRANLAPFLVHERVIRSGEVEITLRGIIEQTRDNCPTPCVFTGLVAGEVKVSQDELSSYGRRVRVLSKLKPVEAAPVPAPLPEVYTLTLSREQMQALAALAGRTGGDPNGWRGHAESAFEQAGEALGYSTYRSSPAYSTLSQGPRWTDGRTVADPF